MVEGRSTNEWNSYPPQAEWCVYPFLQNYASMASIRLSKESKRSPTKVWRPSNLSRTFCIRDEELSLWGGGGGEGERSSAAYGWASFFTQEPSLSLWYPKEETTPALIEKDLLTRTKGSESRGTLKWCKNRVFLKVRMSNFLSSVLVMV